LPAQLILVHPEPEAGDQAEGSQSTEEKHPSFILRER
jgi:hypothetical protein